MYMYTGPSHDASETRRPNGVEPGNINFRTEPNCYYYYYHYYNTTTTTIIVVIIC